MLQIKIFGTTPPCANCKRAEREARKAAEQFPGQIEVLKLDVAFLYELLGASQEHQIKPKKFPQTFIDEVIIGHTNEPEYRRLQNNEYMEALRDRTVKVDIPYITKVSEESKIHEKLYSQDRIPNVHIAPHTLEVAALWAVLSRLEVPKYPYTKKYPELAALADKDVLGGLDLSGEFPELGNAMLYSSLTDKPVELPYELIKYD